jgi:hypothetical protein
MIESQNQAPKIFRGKGFPPDLPRRSQRERFIIDLLRHIKESPEETVENLPVLEIKQIIRGGKEKGVGLPEQIDADGDFASNQSECRSYGFRRSWIVGRIGLDQEKGPVRGGRHVNPFRQKPGNGRNLR